MNDFAMHPAFIQFSSLDVTILINERDLHNYCFFQFFASQHALTGLTLRTTGLEPRWELQSTGRFELEKLM